MKFLCKSRKPEEEETVLFVCVENSGRSQTAEAIFLTYAPKHYSTLSAVTRPSAKLNPLLIEVMREFNMAHHAIVLQGQQAMNPSVPFRPHYSAFDSLTTFSALDLTS